MAKLFDIAYEHRNVLRRLETDLERAAAVHRYLNGASRYSHRFSSGRYMEGWLIADEATKPGSSEHWNDSVLRAKRKLVTIFGSIPDGLEFHHNHESRYVMVFPPGKGEDMPWYIYQYTANQPGYLRVLGPLRWRRDGYAN